MEARPACARIVANSGFIWSFHEDPPPSTSKAGFCKPKPKACIPAVLCNATCLLMCGLGRRGRALPRPFALWVQRMVSGIECSFPNMCQIKEEEKNKKGLAPKAKLVPKVRLQPGIRSCASTCTQEPEHPPRKRKAPQMEAACSCMQKQQSR